MTGASALRAEPLNIGSIKVINLVGSAFSISYQDCQGITLNPATENTCTVVVLVTATAPGTHSGLLRIHIPSNNTVKTQELRVTIPPQYTLPPTAGSPGITPSPTPTTTQ